MFKHKLVGGLKIFLMKELVMHDSYKAV